MLGLISKPKKNQLSGSLFVIIVYGMLALLTGLRHHDVGADTKENMNYFIWINKDNLSTRSE